MTLKVNDSGSVQLAIPYQLHICSTDVQYSINELMSATCLKVTSQISDAATPA